MSIKMGICYRKSEKSTNFCLIKSTKKATFLMYVACKFNDIYPLNATMQIYVFILSAIRFYLRIRTKKAIKAPRKTKNHNTEEYRKVLF